MKYYTIPELSALLQDRVRKGAVSHEAALNFINAEENAKFGVSGESIQDFINHSFFTNVPDKPKKIKKSNKKWRY